MLADNSLARVHGIATKPERNGKIVKLGKRLHAEIADKERWESFDEFTCEEAAYRPINLMPVPALSPLAAEVYKLLTTPFLVTHNTSNDLVYHVLAHNNEVSLMHLSRSVHKQIAKELPLEPPARLDAMRAAARELSELHKGFVLTRQETSIRRPPLPESAREQVSTPLLDEDAQLTALRIGAAADALPSAATLPPRVDYLHALAELLGAPSVGAYPLHKGKGGQRATQPVLYVAVGGADGPPNALASALAGVAISGDALLSSVEYRDSGDVAGLLSAREPCDLPTVLAALHKRSGDVVEFVGTKLGRPLLGAQAIPRVEAWPISGAQWPSPKSILLEYTQANPAAARLREKLTTWAVGPDGVSPPPANTQPRGFRAGFTLDWPVDAPLPDGGVRGDDGASVRMQTPIYSRKAASKQDKVQSAEPHAVVMLLRALHQRNQHSATAASADGSAAATLTPALHTIEFEGADTPDAAESDHPPGALLVVSYTLKLLPTGARTLPPSDDTATDGGGALLTLERREHDPVLLNNTVLVPALEDLLAGMAVDTTRRVLMRGMLLGHGITCALTVTLHSVERPAEETAQQLHFDAFGPGGGGMPHGQQRLAAVADIVAGWAPASFVDVGCGEGKLLEELVRRRVPIRTMLGAEVVGRTLRRAQRKISRVLDAWASARLAISLALAEADGAAAGAEAVPEVPVVELLAVDVTSLSVACEAMALVEVIEHLDPHVFEQLGPALLGLCKPRYLLVTTPNKEWNLHLISRPAEWIDGSMHVPDPGGYPLRNPDHRFEFTRAEFRSWAEGLAAQFGYTARFVGIGGGPFDEVVPYGVWRGAGPQTQAVVFERVASVGAHDGAGAPTDAPLHEHEGAVHWSSQSMSQSEG